MSDPQGILVDMSFSRWPWSAPALPGHLRADADGNRALWAHVQWRLHGLSRRQWRRLLDMPDLLDAAAEAIWLTCGSSVFWGASYPDLNDPRRTSGKRADVVRSIDGFFDATAIPGVRMELRDGTIADGPGSDVGGRLGHFNLSITVDIEQWEHALDPLRRDSRGKVRKPSRSMVRERRSRYLYGAFTQAAIETRTVADLIASPLDGGETLRVVARAQQAAVIVWFEARVAEGMEVEAARVMLALVAHPTVLATVAWDEHGFPFVDHEAGASRQGAGATRTASLTNGRERP